MDELNQDESLLLSHDSVRDAVEDPALSQESKSESADEVVWTDDLYFCTTIARYLDEIHVSKVPTSEEQTSYARIVHERKEKLFDEFLAWASTQKDFEIHCCAYDLTLWRAYEAFSQKNGKESFQLLEIFFAKFDGADFGMVHEGARSVIYKRTLARISAFHHRSLKGKNGGIVFAFQQKRKIKMPVSLPDANDTEMSGHENADGIPYWHPLIIECLEQLKLSEALFAAVAEVRAQENEFMERNLPLVVPIARHYAVRSSVLIHDLIQEGNIGLKKAIERFDYRKKREFSTFAVWWIRHGILRAIGDQKGALRVPVHIRGDQWAVEKKRRLGSVSNKADDLSPEMRSLLWGIDHATSLSAERWPGESFTLEDSIHDRSWKRATEDALRNEVTRVVQEIIAVLKYNRILSAKEEVVLAKRFGLFGSDEDDVSLHDIGKYHLHVSRERARQHEATALQKVMGYIELNTEVRERLAELGWFLPPSDDDDNEEEKTAKASRRAYFL